MAYSRYIDGMPAVDCLPSRLGIPFFAWRQGQKESVSAVRLISDDRIASNHKGQDGDQPDEKGDEREIAFEGERHEFFLSGCGCLDVFIV